MINLICFGDSITEGAEFPHEHRWTTLLQQKIEQQSPGVFRVHNRGISGNTTAQGLDRLASDILPLLPGILLIEFGFNDANVYGHNHVPRVSLSEFERNLREFHRLAVASNSTSVFIVNHLIGKVDDQQGNGISFNENFSPYNKTVKQLADELDAYLIDLPAMMRERNITVEQFVADDQIHLSLPANRHYADMVFDGLNNFSLIEADVSLASQNL